MRPELKYNLTNYLRNHNKKQILLSIFMGVSLIIIICLSIYFEIYNIETINGSTVCNEEKCVLNFYKLETKENYQFVKIKDKKYFIKNIEYAEAFLDNSNNLIQEVTLTLDNYKGKNNEIVEIKLYKNKEKIIKKIFKLIVER